MRPLAPLLAFILGCGGGGQNLPDGGCPTPLCAGTCCAADSICVQDQGGHDFCAVKCFASRDCTGTDPCCEPVVDNGNYSGHGVCQPNPTASGWYSCLCSLKSDCAAGGSCVPLVDSAGFISGPYLCLLDDGQSHHGCAGEGIPMSCPSAQYCSRDSVGNDFCSTPCTTNAMCGNLGVACCNALCSQGSCCGLCGS